ncbi:MAG: hypothetical protein ACLUT1_03880 [Ruminococcus sp.]
MDIEEAENKASEDVVADRESKLAEQLESMKKRKSKLVDPLQYEMSIQSRTFPVMCRHLGGNPIHQRTSRRRTWRNGVSIRMP